MIVIDPSADRLEELEERYPGSARHLADRRRRRRSRSRTASVDKVLGEASESELRRVLRA